MAILDFNYNKAINQANQIDDVADDMLNVANKQLQTTLNSIGASWQGEASQQFIKYCTDIQNDIQDQAKNLRNLAQRIREVARIIREAEEEAMRIQSTKGAGSTGGGVSGVGTGGGGGKRF